MFKAKENKKTWFKTLVTSVIYIPMFPSMTLMVLPLAPTLQICYNKRSQSTNEKKHPQIFLSWRCPPEKQGQISLAISEILIFLEYIFSNIFSKDVVTVRVTQKSLATLYIWIYVIYLNMLLKKTKEKLV